MKIKALLICGILSSLLYTVLNIFMPMYLNGYSSISQTVSELSAVGTPTRFAWVLLAFLYTFLIIAFAWGVWHSAKENKRQQTTGILIFIYGIISLFWPLAPMHQREVLAAGGGNFSDTMHIALASVTVLLMFTAMAFGAAAFGMRFRIYSIASILTLLVFGVLTFLDSPNVAANLPTPWIGVWERINIGVFLLWVIVLGILLLKLEKTTEVK